MTHNKKLKTSPPQKWNDILRRNIHMDDSSQHSKRRRSTSPTQAQGDASQARVLSTQITKSLLKRELERIMDLMKSEMNIAASGVVVIRRNVLFAGLFTYFLVAGRDIAEARLPLSSLPLLRGGHSAFVPSATAHLEVQQVHQRRPLPLLDLGELHRNINVIGSKIQIETEKHWSGLHQNIEREWGKVTSTIGRLLSGRERQTGKLDDVLRAFKSVLNGSEMDTAQLIKACRAHLILMKSGGAALRLVAKDLEANLNKAESLFQKRPEDGKYLASLLEVERNSGIHDGNLLKEDSAAMGLLWIRRSLAFQQDLYASLIPANGRHPKDAAVQAYEKTLSPYHGWLLQKIFPASLSQMPDRRVFIAKFGGTEAHNLDEDLEGEILRKLKTLVSTWEPILNTWRNEFERLDLEDIRRA
jgi:hypothetical protein